MEIVETESNIDTP